jgi:hypothetical protein
MLSCVEREKAIQTCDCCSFRALVLNKEYDSYEEIDPDNPDEKYLEQQH